ncbi:hypothetical protein BU16DRAFT_594372 [Lophium mytilinum]|uniref:Uncharacterized protein n=1 Tax=Lophium mytilinum TaxID=390894 RepID=A0A6A6QJ06_9PEZI|nr:hypothetical protein BU16DRAFT_594372 [Lophium mytilinum]
MPWLKQAIGCHRTYFRLYQRSTPSYASRMFSSTILKIDFHALERKWQAKWDSRGTKIQEERDMDFESNPIIPFYVDHIRRPTIMGALQSILSRKQAAAPRNGKTSMVEQILSSYDTEPSVFRLEDLRTYSQIYGTDVVRTCVIFSQAADTDSPIQEQSVINTQKWFERAWDAVRIAHTSYEATQTDPPAGNPDPETRNDPDLIDDITDYNMDSVKSLVHVPPESPGTLDRATDEDTCALWLASQEAILSMNCESEQMDVNKV